MNLAVFGVHEVVLPHGTVVEIQAEIGAFAAFLIILKNKHFCLELKILA